MKNIKKTRVITNTVLIAIFYIIVLIIYFASVTKYLKEDVYEKIEDTSHFLKISLNNIIDDNINALNKLEKSKDNMEKILNEKYTLGRFYNIVYVDNKLSAKDFNGNVEKLDNKILKMLESKEKNKVEIIKTPQNTTSILHICKLENDETLLAYYDIENLLKTYQESNLTISFLNEEEKENVLAENIKIQKKSYKKLESIMGERESAILNLKLNDKEKIASIESINYTNNKLVYSIEKNYINKCSNRIVKLTAVYSLGIFISYFSIYLYIIFERKLNSKTMHQLAYIDKTSGIANMNKFKEQFIPFKESRRDKDLALISFDIDNFGVINDTFGYDFGDVIIKILGTTLKEHVKDNGICARNANDTFVCLVESSSKDYIEKYMKEYIKKVEKKVELLNVKLNFSFSIGVVKIHKEESSDIDVAEFLNRAYISRICIKGNHKDTFSFYDETLRKNLKDEREMMNDLITAIKENQFKVLYQPKVDLASETIVSAEALIRWEHPVKGLINPGLFIPLAEKTRDIVNIDRIVLEKVCKTLNEWKRKGKKIVPIAVNISKIELYEKTFIDELVKIMKKYDIDPEYLELEITESVALQDTDNIVKLMKYIRKLGLKLSMDDFGTGYSSLSCLKTLPLDFIKIDRSFVVDIECNTDSKRVLEAMITLAKSLKLKVICEGVETEKQLEILKKSKCDIVQGYIYYKPIEVEELAERLVIEDIRKDLV